MANPHKGEVGFEAGGKNYVFRLGTYAQALLERRTKTTAAKFFNRPVDAWGVDDLLSVFYCGLYRQHKMTEEDVADLMDDVGTDRLQEIIIEAIQLANPEADKTASRPPEMMVLDGTGTDSSKSG